jgi:hypothetical protein
VFIPLAAQTLVTYNMRFFSVGQKIPIKQSGCSSEWGSESRSKMLSAYAQLTGTAQRCRRYDVTRDGRSCTLVREPSRATRRDCKRRRSGLLRRADLKDSPAAAGRLAWTTVGCNAGMTAFADGDLLLGASAEEESRKAARTYREKILGK